MGNEYNRFNHHHQHLHMHHHHHRSTFLPMLCSKPSIKDVRLPSSFKKEDPLSPRISCMGQVKRSNKVNGFPTSHRLTLTNTTTTTSNTNSPTNHHHNNFKYSKLKKLFSAKNLTAYTTTTTTLSTTTTTTNSRCRSRRQVILNAASGPRSNGHHHNSKDQNHCVANINVVDLDPPLPVIKRVHKKPEAAQEEEVVGSLWKRRSGGAALEGLQLKLTHHPRHLNQPTTV